MVDETKNLTTHQKNSIRVRINASLQALYNMSNDDKILSYIQPHALSISDLALDYWEIEYNKMITYVVASGMHKD